MGNAHPRPLQAGATSGQSPQQPQQPAAATERRQRGHGKSVSWAQEKLGPATPATAEGPDPAAGSGGFTLDGPAGCLQPPSPGKQQQQQQQQQRAAAQAEQTAGDALPMSTPFGSPGAGPAAFSEEEYGAAPTALSEEEEGVAPAGLSGEEGGAATAGEPALAYGRAAGAGGPAAAAAAAPAPPAAGVTAGEEASRLPLTEETVALLDQQLGSPPGGSPTRRDQARGVGVCPPLLAVVCPVLLRAEPRCRMQRAPPWHACGDAHTGQAP